MKLYPYQQFGVHWLAERRNAYLADAPGLGKTPQAIRAAGLVNANSVLVVSPASMVGTWEEEINTWSVSSPPYRWQVVSYDRLVRNRTVRRNADSFRPDTIIVDEAHYLKSLTSKRQRVVLKLVARPYVMRRWFLSGTPAPNGPHELFTLLRAIWPELLESNSVRTYFDWLNFSCSWTHGEWGPRIWGENTANLKKLGKILYGEKRSRRASTGMMLRRRDKDVEADLPTTDLRRFPVRMDSLNTDLAVLEDLIDDGGQLMSDELPSGEHIATLRRLTGEIKARYMGPILETELTGDGSHKLVVFAYHRSALDTLQNHLAPFGLVRLDGSTPTATRTRLVRQFQTDPRTRVFLSQIQAGGVGITLTAASDVVVVEPSWVPEENHQAIRRVSRITQKENIVRARMVVLVGSLDEAIMRVIMRKQRTLNLTIN